MTHRKCFSVFPLPRILRISASYRCHHWILTELCTHSHAHQNQEPELGPTKPYKGRALKLASERTPNNSCLYLLQTHTQAPSERGRHYDGRKGYQTTCQAAHAKGSKAETDMLTTVADLPLRRDPHDPAPPQRSRANDGLGAKEAQARKHYAQTIGSEPQKRRHEGTSALV